MTGVRALGLLLAQFLLRPQGASAQSESVFEPSSDACGEDTAGSNLLQSKAQQQRVRTFQKDSECGVKGADTTPWIVNGQNATACEWTWQIQLNSGTSGDGHPFCGGSLIGDKWVMTAAHCTAGHSPGDFTVRAGDFNRRDNSGKEQWKNVVRIITNGYNSNTMVNDFAILELESAFTMTDCVGTVCLPGPDEGLVGDETCFITGWGTDRSGGSQPILLQEAEVKTVTNAACRASYGDQITVDMLCANGLNKDGAVTDACQGDSGGPLVCKQGDRWVLHGATSWGNGCADADYPGIWARIHQRRAWILEETGLAAEPAPVPVPTPSAPTPSAPVAGPPGPSGPPGPPGPPGFDGPVGAPR